MDRIQYLLTKAGPRLLNALVDAPQIDCVITGPGMLVEELQLLGNLDALEGCDFRFYQNVADDLEVTCFCGHSSPEPINVRVERHRLGGELIIEVGPPTMYQSMLRIRTRSGRSFRQVLTEALATESTDAFIAVLYAVRAHSHHEHHSSSSGMISRHIRDNAD